ncbi:MAG: hypothetical protein V3V08_21885 [Nannocystaceae bacterium]
MSSLVRAGCIEPADAEAVNRLQRELDAQWGELAVAYNYIRSEQLDNLISQQRRHNMSVGEALMLLGALTRPDRDRLYAAYENEERRRMDHERPPAPYCDSETVSYLLEYLPRLILRVGHFQVDLGSHSIWPARCELALTTSLEINNLDWCQVGIATDRGFAEKLVRTMSGTRAEALDDGGLTEGLGDLLVLLAGAVHRRFAAPQRPLRLPNARAGRLPSRSGLLFELVCPGALASFVITEPLVG